MGIEINAHQHRPDAEARFSAAADIDHEFDRRPPELAYVHVKLEHVAEAGKRVAQAGWQVVNVDAVRFSGRLGCGRAEARPNRHAPTAAATASGRATEERREKDMSPVVRRAGPGLEAGRRTSGSAGLDLERKVSCGSRFLPITLPFKDADPRIAHKG